VQNELSAFRGEKDTFHGFIREQIKKFQQVRNRLFLRGSLRALACAGAQCALLMPDRCQLWRATGASGESW
jgi:hypothetical protein